MDIFHILVDEMSVKTDKKCSLTQYHFRFCACESETENPESSRFCECSEILYGKPLKKSIPHALYPAKCMYSPYLTMCLTANISSSNKQVRVMMLAIKKHKQ